VIHILRTSLKIICTAIIVLMLGALHVSASEGNGLVVACEGGSLAGAISFLAKNGSETSLYVSTPDGATGCLVTFNQSAAFAPAWSPDGSQVGFILLDGSSPTDQQQWVYTVDARTRSVHQLVKSAEFAWSPDSKQIAFSHEADVWVIPAQGGKARKLTQAHAGAYSPSWSPNGKWITYSQPDGIYVMDAATGANPRNLSSAKGSADQFPVWSPDSQWIAFTTNRDGINEQVYIVNAQTGQLQRVSDGKTQNSNPVWSPDSKQIAYMTAPSRKSAVETRIVIGRIDGSAPRRLTKSNQIEMYPSWSQDGSQIVYEVDMDKRGTHKIFLIDADGSNPRQLVKGSNSEGSPIWHSN